MSFLATVGKDIEGVFAWLGSKKGQAIVSGVENVAVLAGSAFGVGGAIQAGENLLNNWITEAVKVETISAAAGQQTGSGATKAAAVLSTMTPQLAGYLQANGVVSADVVSQANAINTAVVNLLNTFVAPAVNPTGGPATTTNVNNTAVPPINA